MAYQTEANRRRAMHTAQQVKNRNSLFSDRKEKNSTTASEAQGIQNSLMRTQQLLRNELQRVNHVSSAIDDDEQILQRTMDQHKSINARNAQKALSSLQRAQRHEQRVLMASVLFFCSVVFYIMWSRVLIKFDFLWSWII